MSQNGNIDLGDFYHNLIAPSKSQIDALMRGEILLNQWEMLSLFMIRALTEPCSFGQYSFYSALLRTADEKHMFRERKIETVRT